MRNEDPITPERAEWLCSMLVPGRPSTRYPSLRALQTLRLNLYRMTDRHPLIAHETAHVIRNINRLINAAWASHDLDEHVDIVLEAPETEEDVAFLNRWSRTTGVKFTPTQE